MHANGGGGVDSPANRPEYDPLDARLGRTSSEPVVTTGCKPKAARPIKKSAAASRRRSGGGASRTKGVAGEREVAALWQAAGFTVRGLESAGDWLVVQRDGRVLHVETKRHERPQWGEWVKQARADAPQGVPWLVFSRRNRGRWLVMQDAKHVIEREARIAELEALIDA